MMIFFEKTDSGFRFQNRPKNWADSGLPTLVKIVGKEGISLPKSRWTENTGKNGRKGRKEFPCLKQVDRGYR